MKPRIFVGSSTESLSVAKAVQAELQHEADVTLWTQNVFRPSVSTIQSLTDVLEDSDFGVFVLAPDDVSIIRGDEHKTARDNVIFELGLFAGKLGMARAFFLIPSGLEDLHLPTDLLGLTPLKYDYARENLAAALGPACYLVSQAIARKADRVKPSGRNSTVSLIASVNKGSTYAAHRLRESSLVRMIGTARQDVLGTQQAASDYLRAAEESLANRSPFTYLRITSSELSAPFRQHLTSLFQVSKANSGARIEIALHERLDTSISYTLFDNEELLLVVDNTVFGSVRDNRLMVMFRDPAVVTAFAEHFDHAWAKSSVKCANKTQFERLSTVRK